MATTDTQICNLALVRAMISARLIALDTDTTKEAKVARDVYALKRDAMQRAHSWNFCKARVGLAAVIPDDDLVGYQYAFALPSDSIRVVAISSDGNSDCPVIYKLETVKVSNAYVKVVLTDADTLFARYVRLVTTPSLFDPSFIEAFAWDLAADFALGIKESSSHAEVCRKEMRTALASARATNGIEDWPDRFPEGSWVTSRDDEGSTGFGGYYY